jgi:hypothetical protein
MKMMMCQQTSKADKRKIIGTDDDKKNQYLSD